MNVIRNNNSKYFMVGGVLGCLLVLVWCGACSNIQLSTGLRIKFSVS